MTDLKKLLAAAGVDGYQINTKTTVSRELFFVKKKLETVRSTESTDVSVKVFADHAEADGTKTKGDSTFSVYASMSEDAIREKIAEAKARANLVHNKDYDLVEGGKEEFSLPSNFEEYGLDGLAELVSDAVFAADAYEGGSINALEVFLYRETTRVENSRGVDKTQTGYRAMIEAIPTWNEGGESVELYEAHHFTVFDPKAVTAEIDAKMREVRDRRSAKKPEGLSSVRVLLRPQEISSLMREFSDDLGYGSVFMHANLHKIGDDLQPDCKGDAITLTMKGEIEGSRHSARFDADGVTLTDKKVIENGKVTGYFGSSRFGQYLGEKEITGSLPCMKLEVGTLGEKELAAAPYLECASLSGIQVDPYNDYIGGEIRLAYYFDGEKTVPVTGISMSGRLSEVLPAIRLSTEKVVYERYEGPKNLLLPNMSII